MTEQDKKPALDLQTIMDISLKETELTEHNFEIGDDYARFADAAVNYLASLINSQSRAAFLFTANYAVIRNALILALLSTLRQHRVQASANLKFALEHASLAAYCLSPDGLAVAKSMRDREGLPDENGFRNSAYRWVQSSYPGDSATLKELKDEINRWESHAGIMATIPVFDYSTIGDDSFTTNFFDTPDNDRLKAGLWRVGWVAVQIAGFLGRVGTDLGGINLADDGGRQQVLASEADRLYDNLSARFKDSPSDET